jgi:hypothetical protein
MLTLVSWADPGNPIKAYVKFFFDVQIDNHNIYRVAKISINIAVMLFFYNFNINVGSIYCTYHACKQNLTEKNQVYG